MDKADAERIIRDMRRAIAGVVLRRWCAEHGRKAEDLTPDELLKVSAECWRMERELNETARRFHDTHDVSSECIE